ncbi:hypothetical protein ACO34A_22390 [Rhizobium sp. ACO-34A]|nr:excalibur calcium-binding domain-containing protein [Rhizobium sp. ACO-34A]ATN36541.1 hypothetical protein ACO34A_22390 [Rhizobium sp. ACO-34A]
MTFLLAAQAADAASARNSEGTIMLAAAQTCKQVASCEEAVELWCNGYRRADADKDGIPCENICHSLEQVEKIRNAIGC